MKTSELRSLDVSALESQRVECQNEAFRLRMLHFTGQLDDTSKLAKLRRQAARISTLIGERAREAGTVKEK